MSADGDILLYGCQVGADGAGLAFIQSWAATTGADVAASTNLTGAQNLGGDWVLETRTGNIETAVPFAVDGCSNYASVLALRNVMRLDLMADFATGAGGQAVFVDKVSTVNSMLAAYRHNTGLLLFVTCGVIFMILLLRYRLKKALLILAVPVIAISITILGLALLGEHLSLFHILPFFLLIGLGVDFGIFFAEDEAGQLSSSTLLTVLLSALTTLFSFGLLTLSTTSAIHSFGLSMLIGLSCDLVLSPIAGNMLVKQREFTRANTAG